MVRLLTGMGRKSIGFAWWPRCSMHGGLGLSSPRVAGEWAEVHRDACEKHSLKSAHLGLAPLSDSMERDAHRLFTHLALSSRREGQGTHGGCQYKLA